MILGIDLGTSNSMAAVYKDGNVEFITDSTGSRLIPSVVSVDENGEFYVGELAADSRLRTPDRTAALFKRSMGTKNKFSLAGKEYSASELSAVVLKHIKEEAEEYLGETIEDAIISVPAFFNNAQRRAVLEAGMLAGFNVRKIINEPTSAALAYGVQGTSQGKFEEKIILVLDLGGGTFDISVMEASDTVMEVVAVSGDNKLGGSDFTNRLMELFIKNNGITDELTIEAHTRLWNAAEEAKLQISDEGFGKMECVLAGGKYEYSISEAEYEKACHDLLARIRKLTIKAIDESKYSADEIEDIIMVGGGTRLSIVKKLMEKMAGKLLDYPISPDEAVVIGAAMQGAMLEKKQDIKELIMTDIAPYYIGTLTSGNGNHDIYTDYEVVLQKNVTIPCKGSVVHIMNPNKFSMGIYQMEDKFGENRSLIGSVSYVVPNLGKGKSAHVHKNIYYDINGIIHVSVRIQETGVVYTDTIGDISEDIDISKADNIVLADHKQEGDRLLIEQADALYMELGMKERGMLMAAIDYFEDMKKRGKRKDIIISRNRLKQLINHFK